MTENGPDTKPKVSTGTLCVYDPSQRKETEDGPGEMVPRRIPFQYNPEQVSRSISPRREEQSGDRGSSQAEALKVSGPPEEQISLTIYIDATDDLPKQSHREQVADEGILPALYMLEMLIHPTADQVHEVIRKADEGSVQLSNAKTPLTLLVLGDSRTLPVNVTKLNITEQAFDSDLNPIRAKVDLSLTVLTSFDLPHDHKGTDEYLAHLRRKAELGGA